jgi:hypothetical protein
VCAYSEARRLILGERVEKNIRSKSAFYSAYFVNVEAMWKNGGRIGYFEERKEENK